MGFWIIADLTEPISNNFQENGLSLPLHHNYELVEINEYVFHKLVKINIVQSWSKSRLAKLLHNQMRWAYDRLDIEFSVETDFSPEST